MPKKYSRKDFLKLSSALTLGLLFTTCENQEVPEKKKVKAVTSADSLLTDDEKTEEIKCELISKEDNGYDELRKGFNKRINHLPKFIALCRTTQDVAEAVRYARKNNLSISVKSGGHSMEGFSGNNGGLVINLSKMNSVEFLEEDKIKVGPGCTLSNLYDHILPKGRIIPAGSCGTVAVGGLTTGGGYGLFSRKYGLTCDHLMEATFVDGNGEIHFTKNNPDLLWALRGGGSGNFGIVTEMIFRSHEAPRNMQSHHFKARNLDPARATTILEKWFQFADQLPESCFAAYVLNGSTINILITNFEEHTDVIQKIVEALIKETDEYKPGKRIELSKKLKNYYGSEVPLNFRNSSAGFYRDFNHVSGCIEKVLENVIENKGMIFQVNTLGGKIKDPAFEEVSCFPHREYNFISEIQAYWTDSSKDEKLKAVSKHCLELLNSCDIKAQYFNYCSLEFSNWQSAYYGNNYEKLRQIKRKYDPDNFVRHPQSIEL